MPEVDKNFKETIAESQKAPSKEVFEKAKLALQKEIEKSMKQVDDYPARIEEILKAAEIGLIHGRNKKEALEKIVSIAKEALGK